MNFLCVKPGTVNTSIAAYLVKLSCVLNKFLASFVVWEHNASSQQWFKYLLKAKREIADVWSYLEEIKSGFC